MNKKQGVVAIFLVVAIILLFFSFVIEFSIFEASKSFEKNEDRVEKEWVGKVSLEVISLENNGGESGKG